MVDWRKIPKIDAHIRLTPKDVIDANIDYDGRFIVNGSIDDYEKIMKTYTQDCLFSNSFLCMQDRRVNRAVCPKPTPTEKKGYEANV